MRALQCRVIAVFGLLAAFPGPAAAASGQVHILNLVDVDGNELSTADGHRTVLILTPRSDANKARLVGDRIPEYCLGNPAYRIITVISFKKNHSRFIRMLLAAMIRRRLDAEAKQLQPRYSAKNLSRNPRRDIHAVADFSGQIRSKLEKTAGMKTFSVFVFSGRGELLRQWNDVPGPGELAAELKM